MATSTQDTARYCFDLVRGADKDRFLSSLFAPDDKRPQLLALYALNVEVARIRDLVSEPMLGEIRLQWWADAVLAAYRGDIPDHPVFVELTPVIADGTLPQAGLSNLIEARRFDLYDDPMPTLNDLEGYLGETSSVLIMMAATLLAGRQAQEATQAAGLAGVAYGLSGLLRLLPLHRSRGQCFIPEDWLAKRGLTPAHVLSGRWDADMQAVFGDMVTHARDRLSEARSLRKTVPGAAMPAFLPVAVTPLALEAVTRKGLNPLKESPLLSQLRRQWTLWRKARSGCF